MATDDNHDESAHNVRLLVLVLSIRHASECSTCEELARTYKTAVHNLAELNRQVGIGGAMAGSLENVKSSWYEAACEEVGLLFQRCTTARTAFLLHLRHHARQRQ
jgi:hypothetical protein